DIALMLPALFIVILSLLFGRAFCGWLCPLGSLIDFLHPVLKPQKKRSPTRYPHLAKIVLVFILITSFLGLPLAGYLDPFSILVRAMVQALYPGINNVAVAFFAFTYDQAPAAVNMVTEPVYSLLKYSVLPFEQKYYELGLVSFFVLASVFLAEFFQRRFFCRNVCPLGALLGWFARVGVLHISGGDDACGKCHHCIKICRMGAIDEKRHITTEACIICIECLEQCPRQVISFAGSTPLSQGLGLSLSRRQFLASLSAGVLLPPVLSVRILKSHPDPLVIRPPGARAEREFLQRCVRCAECIQVCIGNALQPALLQSGIEGIFSPRLVARTGYCEFNCTLCGQVCPTSAIRTLTLAEKHATKIGHAWFDKNLCLPYANGIPCIVCEEHCPTPDKAIKFRVAEVVDDRGVAVTVKQPYIVDDLCIGCGICETRCPLPGRSAVYITSAGEHRNPENRLPVLSDKKSGGSYGNYQ
ncbi:MAG: 4Fe-4S binding protein, partial [Deltaproteobacteria bacterium]|nr:4Fe-4S binding protein [Deltaproteobacteria bacterium]